MELGLGLISERLNSPPVVPSDDNLRFFLDQLLLIEEKILFFFIK